MTISLNTTRYGFYYFPDNLHYRDNDIHKWVSELQALGASWLTLLAPTDRAIPETFIRQISDQGIQPIIQVPLSTTGPGVSDEMSIIFQAYSHWGVKYITLFDRPNQLKQWSPSSWAHRNLVERFLDIYIPGAERLLEAGLIPVFPGLEPGGDYWDTAFLFSALQGLQRRGKQEILGQLVLSAYAWSGNRSLNWGAGGPERWPRTRPYSAPSNSEDHLGFRIFDWYLAISEAVLGKTLPIILLGSGSRIGDQFDSISPAVDVHAHAWQNMNIIKLMSGQTQEFDPVPPEVLTCNFWLLSAARGEPDINDAWYKPDGEELPIVQMVKDWIMNGKSDPTSPKSISMPKAYNIGSRTISHYLLLPTSEWGLTDWHLEKIRPFINKYQPTIGFSPIEASHAKRVTVIGGKTIIPEAIIDGLLAAGCVVEQINGDGMDIASPITSYSQK